jgi:murein DD-endopeptidase MepM/ murein hydrolase activator NlpD
MTNATYQRGLNTLPLMNPSYWEGWVWPVPVWNGRVPIITDNFHRDPSEYRPTGHLGVDVMFPRLLSDMVRGGEVPVDGVHGTVRAVMPDGVPCIAPFVGRVYSADLSPRGHEMRIDHGLIHGIPVNSYVQHLSSFAREWKRGDVVYPGTTLGVVGGDVKQGAYHLQHLHFGLLFFQTPGRPFDSYWVNPEPYMKWWRKVSLEGGPVGTPIAGGDDGGPLLKSGADKLGAAVAATALMVGGVSILRRRRIFL